METRKSSSPETVLGAEDIKAFSEAKNKLFITLYRRRATYFKRWRIVTMRYFTTLENLNPPSEGTLKKLTDDVNDVIEKYAARTERRRENFKASFRHAVSDDGKTIPFLKGMDVLIWPDSKAHRKDLIENENLYHQENQRINPDTKVEQGNPQSDAQEQDRSGDWESQAGESDASSYVPFSILDSLLLPTH